MTQQSISATHAALAAEWCKYHGQRGTDKQIARTAAYLDEPTLARMLAKRGIVVVAIPGCKLCDSPEHEFTDCPSYEV